MKWDHCIGKEYVFRVKIAKITRERVALAPVEISFDEGKTFYPFRDHVWKKRLGIFKRNTDAVVGRELIFKAKVSKYHKRLSSRYVGGRVEIQSQQGYEFKSAKFLL